MKRKINTVDWSALDYPKPPSRVVTLKRQRPLALEGNRTTQFAKFDWSLLDSPPRKKASVATIVRQSARPSSAKPKKLDAGKVAGETIGATSTSTDPTLQQVEQAAVELKALNDSVTANGWVGQQIPISFDTMLQKHPWAADILRLGPMVTRADFDNALNYQANRSKKEDAWKRASMLFFMRYFDALQYLKTALGVPVGAPIAVGARVVGAPVQAQAPQAPQGIPWPAFPIPAGIGAAIGNRIAAISRPAAALQAGAAGVVSIGNGLANQLSRLAQASGRPTEAMIALSLLGMNIGGSVVQDILNFATRAAPAAAPSAPAAAPSAPAAAPSAPPSARSVVPPMPIAPVISGVPAFMPYVGPSEMESQHAWMSMMSSFGDDPYIYDPFIPEAMPVGLSGVADMPALAEPITEAAVGQDFSLTSPMGMIAIILAAAAAVRMVSSVRRGAEYVFQNIPSPAQVVGAVGSWASAPRIAPAVVEEVKEERVKEEKDEKGGPGAAAADQPPADQPLEEAAAAALDQPPAAPADQPQAGAERLYPVIPQNPLEEAAAAALQQQPPIDQPPVDQPPVEQPLEEAAAAALVQQPQEAVQPQQPAVGPPDPRGPSTMTPAMRRQFDMFDEKNLNLSDADLGRLWQFTGTIDPGQGIIPGDFTETLRLSLDTAVDTINLSVEKPEAFAPGEMISMARFIDSVLPLAVRIITFNAKNDTKWKDELTMVDASRYKAARDAVPGWRLGDVTAAERKAKEAKAKEEGQTKEESDIKLVAEAAWNPARFKIEDAKNLREINNNYFKSFFVNASESKKKMAFYRVKKLLLEADENYMLASASSDSKEQARLKAYFNEMASLVEDMMNFAKLPELDAYREEINNLRENFAEADPAELKELEEGKQRRERHKAEVILNDILERIARAPDSDPGFVASAVRSAISREPPTRGAPDFRVLDALPRVLEALERLSSVPRLIQRQARVADQPNGEDQLEDWSQAIVVLIASIENELERGLATPGDTPASLKLHEDYEKHKKKLNELSPKLFAVSNMFRPSATHSPALPEELKRKTVAKKSAPTNKPKAEPKKEADLPRRSARVASREREPKRGASPMPPRTGGPPRVVQLPRPPRAASPRRQTLVSKTKKQAEGEKKKRGRPKKSQ